MNRAIILAVMLIPASAWAQWASDWEGGDYAGRDRAMQCYSAIVERALAAGASTNDIHPPGVFTQRRRLVQYKMFGRDTLAPLYVNPTVTNAAGEYYELSNSAVRMLTYTTACSVAGINTNYFNRTPLFNAGSDTNYGWWPMRAVLNAMVITTVTAGFNPMPSHTENWGSDNEVSGICDDAFANAVNDWDGGTHWNNNIRTFLDREMYEVYAGLRVISGTAEARGYRGSGTVKATGIYNGIAHSARLAGHSTPSVSVEGTATFQDIDSVGLIDNAFMQFLSLSVATTNIRETAESDRIANSLLTSNHVDNPLYVSGLECASNALVGAMVDNPAMLLDWNVANGFKFVP
jgi:hypothetical protein